jgi:hypothetical protein
MSLRIFYDYYLQVCFDDDRTENLNSSFTRFVILNTLLVVFSSWEAHNKALIYRRCVDHQCSIQQQQQQQHINILTRVNCLMKNSSPLFSPPIIAPLSSVSTLSLLWFISSLTLFLHIVIHLLNGHLRNTFALSAPKRILCHPWITQISTTISIYLD